MKKLNILMLVIIFTLQGCTLLINSQMHDESKMRISDELVFSNKDSLIP